MTERVVSFGEDNRLSGVLKGGAGETGLLLLNAGIVHRIGPHRLNVKLARRFDGPSLRFDLSGLGDSARATAGVSHEAQALKDVAAALDLLQDAGVDRVVLAGLCSGADDGYRAALTDARIRGLILLDPYAYGSPRARADRLIEKATDPARWGRALARLTGGEKAEPAAAPDAAAEVVASMPTSQTPEEEALALEGNDRVHPPRDEFGRNLQKLAQSGVDIYILYTNFVAELLTKPSHFLDTFKTFDFGDRLTVDVNGESDHTYTTLASQEALFAQIDTWMAARRGVSA
ncbi:MAG: hypothetical protein AAF224_04340 [Pseudomonadota bacterium]